MENLFLENVTIQTEAIFIPILVGILAYLSGALDGSGSFITAFLGILVYHASGPFFFGSLISFLAIGSLVTAIKHRYGPDSDSSEPSGRSVNPVLANGIIPAFMAVLGNPFYFISSTSAALADTLASEIGSFYGSPRSITTLEEVEPGTRGAVSPLGQLAAVLGAAIMGFVGVGFASLFSVPDFYPYKLVFISTIAGFFGCQIDSFLGSSLDFLSKEEINLLGTLSGAIFSIVLYFLLV